MATFSKEAKKWIWEEEGSRSDPTPWCQFTGVFVCAGRKLEPGGLQFVGRVRPGGAQIPCAAVLSGTLWPVLWYSCLGDWERQVTAEGSILAKELAPALDFPGQALFFPLCSVTLLALYQFIYVTLFTGYICLVCFMQLYLPRHWVLGWCILKPDKKHWICKWYIDTA